MPESPLDAIGQPQLYTTGDLEQKLEKDKNGITTWKMKTFRQKLKQKAGISHDKPSNPNS
jgi:hypothetical protein